jgi:bacteriorhodopsin
MKLLVYRPLKSVRSALIGPVNSSNEMDMEGKGNAVWTWVAVATAAGVAAATISVIRRGKRPTPERVIEQCLSAVEELEARIRTAASDLIAA